MNQSVYIEKKPVMEVRRLNNFLEAKRMCGHTK